MSALLSSKSIKSNETNADNNNQSDPEVIRVSSPGPIVMSSSRDIIQMAIIGTLSGVVTWSLVTLLSSVFEQQSSPSASIQAAGVFVGGFIALLALIRMRAYRPLLIVLAVIISIGGISHVLVALPWSLGLGFIALIFGLSYVTFGWVSRISSFWICLITTIVLVVVTRLTLQLT